MPLSAPIRKIIPTVQLRRATTDDAERLLAWRTDPVSRRMMFTPGDDITMASHVAWLKRTLAAPDRILLIGESEDEPVGTVRLDFTWNGAETSWTVAPELRGNGYGSAIVLATAQLYSSVLLSAEIKAENVPSIRTAERAEFVFQWEREGIRTYWRRASTGAVPWRNAHRPQS